MLFFKIHLTPFQRQENIWSILTATNSFFCISMTGFKSNVLSISSPLQNRWITFPSDKQVFGALPHFSRVKIDCALAQKAKSMQCKKAPCFLVFETHAGRITNWTVSCSAIWGKYVGILSRYEQSADNAVCPISGRRHQALSFGTNSDVFSEFGLDLREVHTRECSNSKLSLQSLYWL